MDAHRRWRANRGETNVIPPFVERILSPKQYEIKEEQDVPGPFPQPVQIIVREVDLMISGQGISFAYNQPDRAQPAGNLQTVLAYLKDDAYIHQDSVDRFHRPLDLNLRRPSYIIFRLNSRWNWRFSHKAKAVTIGELEDQSEVDHYCNLRHVLKGYQDQPMPFPSTEHCRVAYFKAKPAGRANYHHAFNLNVEIVHPDVYGDEPNTLPLVIDPDIRNPGGSSN